MVRCWAVLRALAGPVPLPSWPLPSAALSATCSSPPPKYPSSSFSSSSSSSSSRPPPAPRGDPALRSAPGAAPEGAVVPGVCPLLLAAPGWRQPRVPLANPPQAGDGSSFSLWEPAESAASRGEIVGCWGSCLHRVLHFVLNCFKPASSPLNEIPAEYALSCEECNREPCHPSDPTMPMQNAALAALPMSRDTMGVKACKNMKARILLTKKSEISTKCRFTSILCSFQFEYCLSTVYSKYLRNLPFLSPSVLVYIRNCGTTYIVVQPACFYTLCFCNNDFWWMNLNFLSITQWSEKGNLSGLEIEMFPSPCSSPRSQSFWCDIDHSFYFRSVIKIHVFSHCLMSF